ncbi:hypothetical protein EV182_002488 [Spiromyces aspiralis]|uniref:Uncharacterized protein n=1 Tax=Spiromyces aspiralis TaxID=68401 RepID=A0ACC1HDZ3_9FUNG|nr:hypothetical protein EV182_002488 [Spiromyces aspiralis]
MASTPSKGGAEDTVNVNGGENISAAIIALDVPNGSTEKPAGESLQTLKPSSSRHGDQSLESISGSSMGSPTIPTSHNETKDDHNALAAAQSSSQAMANRDKSEAFYDGGNHTDEGSRDEEAIGKGEGDDSPYASSTDWTTDAMSEADDNTRQRQLYYGHNSNDDDDDNNNNEVENSDGACKDKEGTKSGKDVDWQDLSQQDGYGPAGSSNSFSVGFSEEGVSREFVFNTVPAPASTTLSGHASYRRGYRGFNAKGGGYTCGPVPMVKSGTAVYRVSAYPAHTSCPPTQNGGFGTGGPAMSPDMQSDGGDNKDPTSATFYAANQAARTLPATTAAAAAAAATTTTVGVGAAGATAIIANAAPSATPYQNFPDTGAANKPGTPTSALPARASRVIHFADFVRSFIRLLRIAVPGLRSKESLLFMLLSAALGLRTFLDVWFSRFNARVVSAIVVCDRSRLMRRLLPEYMLMMLPLAVVNQGIKWILDLLSTSIRIRLSRKAYQYYEANSSSAAATCSRQHSRPASTAFSTDTVHTSATLLGNSSGDSGTAANSTEQVRATLRHEAQLARTSWLLSLQIHRFSQMLPRVFSDFAKPIADIFVFSRLLSSITGSKGPGVMASYLALASMLSSLISPPVSKYLAKERSQELGFRQRFEWFVTRTEQAARSVSGGTAFDGSGTIMNEAASVSPQIFVSEHRLLLRKLQGLKATSNQVGFLRFASGILDSVLLKYGATLTAYLLLAKPLLNPTKIYYPYKGNPVAIMYDYSLHSSYLINLTQAMSRFLMAIKDAPRFVSTSVNADWLFLGLQNKLPTQQQQQQQQ